MNKTKILCTVVEQNGGEYTGEMFMRALDINIDENSSKKFMLN